MKTSYFQKFGSFIVLFYGLLILYFYFGNYLRFLVNPIYNFMILACGLLLIAMAVYSIINGIREAGCDPKHSMVKELMIGLLLIVPLILGVIFQPQLLSSDSALLRGVNANLSSSDFNPAIFTKPPQERTLIEWVKMVNIDPEPLHYEGQAVHVEGMIIFDERLGPNSFYITQFILTCCAADARTVALPVVHDSSLLIVESDRWIRLEGKMVEGEVDGNRQVVIQLSDFEYISTPEDPYETL